MVAFGLGSLAFASLLARPAAIALASAGIASFAVAAFPCTQGCPGTGSFTDVAHVAAAAAFYVAFVLTAAFEIRRGPALPVVGAAALALAVHGSGIGPNGLLQRVGLTILDAWLFVTALRYARSAEDPPTTGGG